MRSDLVIVFLVLLFITPLTSSLSSNASIAAEENLSIAESCLETLIGNNIIIVRANDSFTQANQLYNAQIALEKRSGNANYDLVIEYSQEVCHIKDIAIKARDELKVFQGEYDVIADRVNLSAMDETYSRLLSAYEEERFEDVLESIDEAYAELSKTEADQTKIELFYRATTKSIADFFSRNWKTIIICLIILAIVLVIFWKALKRRFILTKLRDLRTRKNALNSLLKKTQMAYFQTKKMSEMEFHVKMKTFKELMLDIDRQLPMYNEQLAKIDKSKKVYK